MSQFQSVATEEERRLRRMELDARDRDAEAAAEEGRRADSQFTKIYPKGWARLQQLIKDHPAAARVFAFLAEHIDSGVGAVVVAQEVMANELGIHERTVRRQLKLLEELGAVVTIKVGTGVNAYCLHPDEVWKSWVDKKETAAFFTKTLVSKSSNGEVRRKLKVMLTEKGE